MSTPNCTVDNSDLDAGTCDLSRPSAFSVNHSKVPLIRAIAAPRTRRIGVVVEELRQWHALGVLNLGKSFEFGDELVDLLILTEFETDDTLQSTVVEGIERTGDKSHTVAIKQRGVLFHLRGVNARVFIDHKLEVVAVHELEVQMPINVVGIQRLCPKPQEGEAKDNSK